MSRNWAVHVFGYHSVLELIYSFYPLVSISRDLVHHIGGIIDGPAMFLVALLDSSFLSIPEGNDILIVGLSIGKVWPRVAYYVGMTAAGSIVGCILLYSIGRHCGSSLIHKRISPARVAKMRTIFRKYGTFALLVPCILPPPCPFKVFVLSAGAFGIRTTRFILAVTLGRLIRYSTWGVLAYHYGESVKRYTEAHLPAVGTALFAGFVSATTATFLIVYLRRRFRQASSKNSSA